MDQTTSSPPTDWPPRRVALATLTVLGIAFAFWIFIQFRMVFFSLFIAIVLSTAIVPLIDRLGHVGIPRALSIILVSLIALALVVGLVILVAPRISEQFATITSLISSAYADLQKALASSPSLMIRRMAIYMPSTLSMTPAVPAAPANQPANNIAEQAYNIGASFVRGLILTVSVLLLTGLWMLEGDIATRVLLMGAPPQRRDAIRDFLSDMENKIGAYTRGLAILTLVMGGMAAIAYAIIGLPNVLLLGVIAGLMEIVPLVGPALGAIPALLVAASTDPTKVVWVLVAYIIIQFAESHFIVPRIMDRAVGVNPVASLLAFVAFGTIFGFFGAVLAVPLAAVIQLILNRFVFDVSPTVQAAPIGRNAISTLRYEAQDLVADVRKQIRDKDTEVTAHADRIEDSMEAIAEDLDSILAKAETPENGTTNGNGQGVR